MTGITQRGWLEFSFHYRSVRVSVALVVAHCQRRALKWRRRKKLDVVFICLFWLGVSWRMNMSSLGLICLPSHSPAWFPVCTVRCWPPPLPTSPTACDCEGRCRSWRARCSALPSLVSLLVPAPWTTPEGWGKPLLCRHHWRHTLYDRSACGIWCNPFTAVLVALSLGKQPVKVPNLKSLGLFSPFAWEQVKGFL